MSFTPSLKRLFLPAILLVFSIAQGFSATLYSISASTPSWSNPASWSLNPVGPPCSCTPVSSDNVTVQTNMQLNTHLVGGSGISGVLTINASQVLEGPTYDLEIKNSGYLYVYGTLSVRNLTFANGSHVIIASGAVVNVYGDFSNNNNSDDVVVDGTLNIAGNAYNGNGGHITGSGTINTTNPFTGSGTFGPDLSMGGGVADTPDPEGPSSGPIRLAAGSINPSFDLHVFPNPATSKNLNVTLENVDKREVLVVVTDILGKEYYSKVLLSEQENITFAIDPHETLQPGIYLVTASSNDKFRSRKIVVQ